MKKNNYPGKFIVFEGLDGSGQSTQAGLLKNFLIEKGFEVILTKEPTLDSEAGRKLRRILDEKEKIEPAKFQELFVQDRREHLENLVITARKQSKYVISDRYFYSTFAFGSSEEVDLEWLIKINDNFLTPDVVFLMKVSPEVCVARIDTRGRKKTYFEKVEKLSRAWEIYKILPQRFGEIIIVDGERKIPEIFEEIKKIISQRFKI